MKKTYFFLIVFFFLLLFISYGAILKYHYDIGGNKYKYLQKISVFFADMPFKAKNYLAKQYTDDEVKRINNKKLKKKKFKKNLKSSREELLLISRYDGDLKIPVVEIRDLNNFKVLHAYKPKIKEIYEKTNLNKLEFETLIKDKGFNKFRISGSVITSKGELIFHNSSPIVKTDFCGKIIWVNDNDKFHGSTNLDYLENIYTSSRKFPFSKKVEFFVGNNYLNYEDDAVNILNQSGKIVFNKSVTEILIENNLGHRIFSQQNFNPDPIQLNDVVPVQINGPFFKKGDLFLSLRHLSMVILYRPSNNKIVKVIEGGFNFQSDVDIIDDKTISIYNNNVFLNHKNKQIISNNEIVLYDFNTNTFSKKLENVFKKLKINSKRYGSIEALSDGSTVIEDTENGRILYLNKEKEIIWEFNNLSNENYIYNLFNLSVIKGNQINKIKNLILEKKQLC